MSETRENGFNPKAHLTQIQGRDYLEVKWRLVWFREEHPASEGWGIITRAEEVTADAARFRAEIVDAEGRVLATGTKTETPGGFSDYVEKAETGSIGRALALLGYGTQWCAGELEEGERIVDSPVGKPKAEPQADGDSEFGPCPDCGGDLHLRKRKDGSGQFVACTNYPKCEFTCNVEEAPRPEGDFDGPVDAANLKDEAAEVFGDDLPGVTKYSELKAWMQDDLGVGEDDLAPLRKAACHVCFGVVPKVADISASNWQQLMSTIRDAVQSGDVAGFIADAGETKA